MSGHRNRTEERAAALRQEAAERVRRRDSDRSDLAEADVRALVHELEVHRVELETQNEELRQAEQALTEARDRYRELYECAPVGYLTLDAQGTVLEANLAATHLCGRSRGDLVGRRLEQLLQREDRDGCYLLLRNARAEGAGQSGEARLPGPEEETRWVRIEAAPRLGEDGHTVGFLVTLSDITERKAAEAARQLAHSQAETRRRYLEAVMQALPVGVVVTDAQGGVVLTNRGDEAIWGERPATRSVEDYAQYRAWWVDSGRPVLPHEWASARAVREGETVLGQLLKIEGFDGSRRYVHNSAVPIRDAQDNIIGCAVVIQDITELRQTEEALREADRRKDAFLATLAHELRNPLAPLRTGLDLIEMLRGDASACEEPLRTMDRQLTHLVRLVDDLMDVSRISRGNIRLQKERLDLVEIIEAALEMSESELSRGDRHLTVSVPSQPLPVEGDRVRLVQVVSNLLNNAAKFTDEGGHIDLRVVPAGDRVEIEIQDDGRGIPPERLTDIFEMFSQAESGRREGLGIGLTLVRNLIQMHGGAVSAQSQGPGCGATFTVSLPLRRSAPARSTARKETEADLVPPRRRVLMVDDNRDIAEAMRLLLTNLKADVRVAHDGAEALRICADWQPTHVLMDLGMPGMDGYEAARRLRENHPDRPFKLVAVTGWGQEDDRQQTREAGFDKHLVKPVGVAELKALLAD